MKSMPAQSLLRPVLIGLEAHLEAMEQILFLVIFRDNEIQPGLAHYLSQKESAGRQTL